MRWNICLGVGAFALLTACNVSEPTVTPAPSGGAASLQTAPFTDDGRPAGIATAPGAAATPAPADSDVPDFTSVAANFDPSRQHFIYVLPPGLHAKAPWEMHATVRHRGELKFETTLPLTAEILPGGARPEYPKGYEVVRLSGDGNWSQATAELDKVIQGLIAQFGRGDGSVEMSNNLNIAVDDAFQADICGDKKPAPMRFYLEEDGKAELLSLNSDAMSVFYEKAVAQACEALAKPN